MKGRIFALSIVLYICIWLLSAHLVKKNTEKLIEDLSDDNISLSYEKVLVSGFPFFWDVTLYAPKVTHVEQNGFNEVTSDKVVFKYKIYSLEVIFDKEFNFNDSESNQGKYSIVSEDNHKLYIEFEEPILLAGFDDFIQNMKVWNLNLAPHEGRLNDVIISRADNFEVNITHNNKGLIAKFNTKGYGTLDDEEKSEAEVSIDADYSILKQKESEKITDDTKIEHQFVLNKLNLKFVDSELDLSGVLNLKMGQDPDGQFKLMLKNYKEILDKIIHNGFPIPKDVIKNFIEESAISTGQKLDSEQIRVDIIFSEEGLKVSRKSL